MDAFSPFPWAIAPGVSVQLVEQTQTHIYGRVQFEKGTRGYGRSPGNDPRVVVSSARDDVWFIVYRIETTDPDSALKELEHIALALIQQHKTPIRDALQSPVVFYLCLASMCALDYFRNLPTWLLVLDGFILAVLTVVIALCLCMGKGKP